MWRGCSQSPGPHPPRRGPRGGRPPTRFSDEDDPDFGSPHFLAHMSGLEAPPPSSEEEGRRLWPQFPCLRPGQVRRGRGVPGTRFEWGQERAGIPGPSSRHRASAAHLQPRTLFAGARAVRPLLQDHRRARRAGGPSESASRAALRSRTRASRTTRAAGYSVPARVPDCPS